jgi:penicillin-binding protein 2
MDLKFDKKCFTKKQNTGLSGTKIKKNLVRKIGDRNTQINGDEDEDITGNNSRLSIGFLLVIFASLAIILLISVFQLQVLEGEKMYARSERNQINLISIHPRRGIIFDRNGEKLVENKSVVDCFLNLHTYLDSEGNIDDERLRAETLILEDILGDDWIKDVGGDNFSSILERIYVVLENEPDVERIKIASAIDNDKVISLKSLGEEVSSVYLEEGIERYYPHKEYLSNILGYTSIVNAEDFENLSYVGFNDVVGRAGVEKYYDEVLFGEKGHFAVEVNALGQPVSDHRFLVKETVPGKSLYLSIDLEAQKKSYEILKGGVEKYKAASGTMILQDVKTGEILVMSSYPSYDNNLFIKGISQKDFEKLLFADGNPLTNKAIAAQLPPGSIFKTIVASSAFDAGKVKRDTVYVSRRGYTFSGGQSFQEFRNSAYGRINLIDALMVSSNIYFCEIIRGWNIEGLVPYLENFGIGEYTGIDIPGEAPGRLASPENKVALAKSTSPWLEPYWLPEGDSCNTVIGQGITTVTPIQAVNWTSAMANGGILHTPHLGMYVSNSKGQQENLDIGEIRRDFVSKDSLKVAKEGMRASVAGPRSIVSVLAGVDVEVAAKTGTAEFGRVGADGKYEHTHAWVIGFFPYEEPEYAFVILLEDGGESSNSAHLSREFLDWFVEEKM